eukprot:CAMPEP_0113948536 /NCGR_PEP_ID=MMETSP1339-20121228/70808_1 /TAXON_ID=94617 /ORGANISM="Fibrocapsa japonica" /LENGTH=69 /DNA_ID=CAMNT_0000955631 /DNA_START=19 /DNA_END=225 /DNA_ORIENTATION=- /assembly_acc=CAM_ASM_000762
MNGSDTPVEQDLDFVEGGGRPPQQQQPFPGDEGQEEERDTVGKLPLYMVSRILVGVQHLRRLNQNISED